MYSQPFLNVNQRINFLMSMVNIFSVINNKKPTIKGDIVLPQKQKHLWEINV